MEYGATFAVSLIFSIELDVFFLWRLVPVHSTSFTDSLIVLHILRGKHFLSIKFRETLRSKY